MQSIIYSVENRVATIALNRPDRLNTFRQQEYELLEQLLQRFAGDDDAAVLILTASGPAFSAGQDLNELATDRALDADHQASQLARLQQLTRLLAGTAKPKIAALNGFAVGVGLELALACDFRLAVPDAYFMFAEAQRGLFQTNGVLYYLPRLIGLARAKEMLLTGDKFSTDYALEAGLIQGVSATDSLLADARRLAGRLRDNSPLSIRLIQDALDKTYGATLEEMLELEVRGNKEVFASRDFIEGVTAFLNKREPSYQT
ncbi:enoyl-CoA hydratase/isomerase family protein [Parahaliea mediterranea]|uniref:Enoyl-CoA hydratase/isomerase family protein n=1 Tax=Parahaliea mediterranea TaxID=651086 RepID=A0A939DEL3_9GAMM|nr:enoyl-CoA hydratase-related protein [Parahaliea mediterranea]MBN7796850.1 enoyl-CoA hydratase/isomerase family protein [Parahaliea mediterranea]